MIWFGRRDYVLNDFVEKRKNYTTYTKKLKQLQWSRTGSMNGDFFFFS